MSVLFRRNRRGVWVLSMCLPCLGCSLIYNDNYTHAQDAGPPTDTGTSDVGDTGDTMSGDIITGDTMTDDIEVLSGSLKPYEVDCDDSDDNDVDGMTDCEDPECEPAATCCNDERCCTTGKGWVVEEDWRSSAEWKRGGSDTSRLPVISDGQLINFGLEGASYEWESSLIRQEPIDISAGARFTFAVNLERACSAGDCGDQLVRFGLSNFPYTAEGNRVSYLFNISVDDTGCVSVWRRGNHWVWEEKNAVQEGIPVVITADVKPQFKETGTVMILDVYKTEAGEKTPLKQDIELLTLRELNIDMAAGVSDVYPAVAGFGDRVQVGEVNGFIGNCALANRFEPLPNDRALTREMVLHEARYGEGGFGEPTVVSARTQAGAWQYRMFFDATTEPRINNSALRPLSFVIGGAASAGENLFSWSPEEQPLEIECVTCAEVDATEYSHKEPDVVRDILNPDGFLGAITESVVVPGDGFQNSILRLVSVREDGTMEHREVIKDNECDSLRFPDLLPIPERNFYYLSYTCVMRTGTQSEIRSVALGADNLKPKAPSVSVFSVSQIYPEEGCGANDCPEIRNAELVTDNPDDPVEIRMWVVVKEFDAQEPTVWLARTWNPGHVFEPYPENPVARKSDMPDCGDDCEILGFAALPKVRNDVGVRFLVGRKVGADYDFKVMEQAWDIGW